MQNIISYHLPARRAISLFVIIFCISLLPVRAQFLSVTPRTVHATDISLIPLFGDSAMRTVERATRVLAGQTALFDLTAYPLPGEYLIRYDYVAREGDHPYPSEQYLIIGREGLSIRLNPMYPMTTDSVIIERDGGELNAWTTFQTSQQQRRVAVLSMRQWLMSETPSGKSYYRSSLREYERRRTAYNSWVRSMMEAQGERFVRRMMQFSLVPAQSFRTPGQVISASEYLSPLDLKDTLLLNTRSFADHLQAYMRQAFEGALPGQDRDSVMTVAASGLMEAASAGHPRVYGAVADQLFSLFTRIGFDAGITVLGPHVSTSGCQTTKKEAIFRKLAAMGRLQIGAPLFDIEVPGIDGRSHSLSSLVAAKPQTLLLFWSAGCQHCLDLIEGMKTRFSGSDLRSRLQVVALSIDDAAIYQQRWKEMTRTLPDWHHGLCQDGPRSPVARAFGVLATPTMFLIDREGFRLRGMPADLEALYQFFKY